MAAVFFIDNTVGGANPGFGGLSFSIPPGRLNGPGGTERDSDLRLFGLGALLWGEGIDENLYRITEHFACPAKQLNDFNPASGNNDYNPATNPILPKDERDLGPGNGITVPLNGQVWYNTTTRSLFVFDSTLSRWKSANAPIANTNPPPSPQVGDFWYDLSATDVGGCISNPQLKIYNPTHPNAEPSGWVLVGEDFVRQCGDTMTGILSMSGNRITNLGTPTSGGDATTKTYVDAADTSSSAALTTHAAKRVGDGAHLTLNEDTFLANLSLSNPSMFAASVNGLINVPSGYDIFARIEERLKVNGSNSPMTGFLTLVGVPTATNHAATKGYVDTQVSVATNLGNAQRFVRFFSSSAGGQGQLNGDIHVSGSVIFIWAAGAFRQVFPAQYTP